MPRKQTQQEVIAKFREVHGEKYNYSFVNYVNSATIVNVVCPVHGEFPITPNHHSKGVGCPNCWYESQRTTKEEFVAGSRKHFGDRNVGHRPTLQIRLVRSLAPLLSLEAAAGRKPALRRAAFTPPPLSFPQAIEACGVVDGVGHDVVRSPDNGRGRYDAPDVRVEVGVGLQGETGEVRGSRQHDIRVRVALYIQD